MPEQETTDVTKKTIRVGERECTLRLFGAKEWEDFLTYVRTTFIKTIRDSMNGLPREDAIEVLKAAFLRLPQIHKLSAETIAAQNTPEGEATYRWLLLRHNEGLTIEDVRRWIES